MLSAPASNEFKYFASYMDAKGHCPQVVKPWPIITSNLINETGLSWLYLSIFQGSVSDDWRNHIISAETEFQVLGSLRDAMQALMFVLRFPDGKTYPYIFGQSWARGSARSPRAWYMLFANLWVLELLLSLKQVMLLYRAVYKIHVLPWQRLCFRGRCFQPWVALGWIQRNWLWLENSSSQFHHLSVTESTHIAITYLLWDWIYGLIKSMAASSLT